jgi:hypothetical protein
MPTSPRGRPKAQRIVRGQDEPFLIWDGTTERDAEASLRRRLLGAHGCRSDERHHFSEAVVHGRRGKWLGWVSFCQSVFGLEGADIRDSTQGEGWPSCTRIEPCAWRLSRDFGAFLRALVSYRPCSAQVDTK